MNEHLNIARIKIKATPTFLVSLTLLLLNDFYLKYHYPSVLTGKLSDFAGLFIFPFFFSAFFKKQSRHIYILTGLLFIFWKSSLSQPFIDWLCNLTTLGFYRTVDPTDLIALTVLPFSYFSFQKRTLEQIRTSFSFSLLVCAVSVFSFCATTLPRQGVQADTKSSKIYLLPITKEVLFSKLNAGHGYSDTLQKNLQDSLFYLYFCIPDFYADVTAISEIISIGKDSVSISLDSITKYEITGRLFKGVRQENIDSCKNLKAEQLEKYFEENYLDIISGAKKSDYPIYFDNKEILDSYEQRGE